MLAIPTWVKERESKCEDWEKQEKKNQYSLLKELYGSLGVALPPDTKRQSGGSLVSIFLQLLLTEATVNVGECGWSNVGSRLQALGRNRETALVHILSRVANFADAEL